MSYYSFGENFKWFMARVVDNKDPDFLGRLKIRVIHEQTGDLGKKKKTYGLTDDDLLWAYPMSAIQSASLSFKKVQELEDYPVPDWIDAVGLSPTGSSIGTYVFGFYLDGTEENIPIVMGSYHKLSMFPEPPTDEQTGAMLQTQIPEELKLYYDVAALAKGFVFDPEAEESRPGQTLPKEPYAVSTLWKDDPKGQAPVDEFVTAYNAEYPYNLTYTTKAGHAIELDDTIGYERLHLWHKSGTYEEISSGTNPQVDDDDKTEWPTEGPVGYTYITAGGVAEDEYDGRRNRKTMDSFFDTVIKDRNELTKRDHNTEVANTETMRIGNVQLVTVGHSKVTGNRINDNNETDYSGGGLGQFNSYFDVANNTTQTSGNNFSLQVGFTPDSESRLTDADKFNAFFNIANNSITTIGNNDIVTIGNNQIVDIGNDCTVTVGRNCTIIVKGNASIDVSGTTDIKSGGKMTISSGVEIDMDAPTINIGDAGGSIKSNGVELHTHTHTQNNGNDNGGGVSTKKPD